MSLFAIGLPGLSFLDVRADAVRPLRGFGELYRWLRGRLRLVNADAAGQKIILTQCANGERAKDGSLCAVQVLI